MEHVVRPDWSQTGPANRNGGPVYIYDLLWSLKNVHGTCNQVRSDESPIDVLGTHFPAFTQSLLGWNAQRKFGGDEEHDGWYAWQILWPSLSDSEF